MLQEQEQELLSRGMAAEAAQSRQIWGLCLGLLDTLHSLLADRKVTPELICSLMQSGLEGMEISALPPEPDMVTVGEAGHLMTGSLRALALMGLQAGDGNSSASLLTDRERAQLSETLKKQVGLAKSVQTAMRQADLYRTVALPSEKLLLTFSASDQAGKALVPSGMVGDVKKMFHLEEEGSAIEGRTDTLPPSPALSLEELGRKARGMSAEEAPEGAWLDALRWMWASPEWQPRTAGVLDALRSKPRSGTLLPELAGKLFSSNTTSISRLEKFAECPYQHFMEYGLRLKKPEEFVFDNLEQGTFFHEVLERFASSAGKGWGSLNDDEVEALLEQALAQAQSGWDSTPLREDGLGELQGAEAVRRVRNTVWACTRQLRNADFVPLMAEATFGSGQENSLEGVVLTLPDGRRICLNGKIDRVDGYEGENGYYIRITDYKSGGKELKPEELWHGLQLQLMLYLRVAQRHYNGVPAGALYMQVHDPMVKVGTDDQATAAAERAKAMRLKGYILAEPEVVDAMNRGEEGYSFAVSKNRDGSISRRSKAVSRRQMEGMMHHAEKKAAELEASALSGQIEAVTGSGRSPCDYCVGKELCGGGAERDLKASLPEDPLEQMALEAEADGAR